MLTEGDSEEWKANTPPNPRSAASARQRRKAKRVMRNLKVTRAKSAGTRKKR